MEVNSKIIKSLYEVMHFVLEKDELSIIFHLKSYYSFQHSSECSWHK